LPGERNGRRPKGAFGKCGGGAFGVGIVSEQNVE
jgi:hypothetical protein